MYLKILVRKFLAKHKKAAKTAADKAITTAASKTGEHLGKKAGDEIIKMISNTSKPMTQQDRYQQLGQILSDD